MSAIPGSKFDFRNRVHWEEEPDDEYDVGDDVGDDDDDHEIDIAVA